jgi:hypothetical protein
MRLISLAATLATALLIAPAALATVQISSKPTANMTCAGGTCSPTAKKAVLNVGDLANMLAGGDITVTSDSRAKDIQIEATLSWASTHRLTLDSFQSIAFDKPVVVTGTGALTITVNDGGHDGDFSFTKKGHVEFWDTTSNLIVNGDTYELANSIATLASDIAANQSGNFALARDYDAKPDGAYKSEPVPGFSGVFEGLGNHIKNLKVHAKTFGVGGLFGFVSDGTMRDIGLDQVDITARTEAGALVANGGGSISNCYATGSIATESTGDVGGLLGSGGGTITNSFADVSISAGSGSSVGGLVGSLGGTIVDSHASGTVVSGGGSDVGGLVGFYNGTILRSYSTAEVRGAAQDSVGGLIGDNSGTVTQSYATGAVTGGTGASVGGLIGLLGIGGSQSYSTGRVSGGSNTGGLIGRAGGSGGLDSMYWDLDTSGISDPSKGAGDVPDDPGITGLTTEQFQSQLPQGFDPKVWRQKPNINNGYPYLIANPPPK